MGTKMAFIIQKIANWPKKEPYLLSIHEDEDKNSKNDSKLKIMIRSEFPLIDWLQITGNKYFTPFKGWEVRWWTFMKIFINFNK